jgi:hypothetical protein
LKILLQVRRTTLSDGAGFGGKMGFNSPAILGFQPNKKRHNLSVMSSSFSYVTGNSPEHRCF